jgi:hypothetical protein
MHTIVSLFKEEAELIERNQSLVTMTNRKLDSAPATERHHLFLHAKYHSRCIPRRMIHQLYNHTLVKTKLFDDFVITYHQPKNLRDLLSKTKLQSSPTVPKASKLVSSVRSVSNL